MTDTKPSAADLRPANSAPLFAGVLLLLALLGLTLVHALPGEPLPADAPAGVFSEARAREALTRILGDESPHPVGSEEGAAVRARILTELRALGLRPEERPGFACGERWGSCAPVVNILARLPGRRDAKAVLISTHHDSVGAGPGASDAGASVASIVEIARALLAGEPLERPVLLLLNDGEEAGLLGARAFLEEPEAGEVFAVVNGEARGTDGPSALFETGPGNAAFVSAWAKQVSRPVTSSTLYGLYKLLPSDTDLTVYKAQGWPGLNFAFADGHSRYHTPLDDLAHLDPRTLQHHGDNMLAAVRALASLPDEASGGPDAVWLDVLSFGVLTWPLSWNWPLAGLALVLWLAAAAASFKRRLLSRGESLAAFLGVFASVLLPQLAALGIVAALQALRGDASPWTAHPAWATTAVVAAGALVSLLIAAVLARRVGAWAWWLASGLLALAITGPLVRELPGGSSLGIVPALALNSTLLLACLSPRRLGTPLLLLGLAVAAWPWLSLAHALHVMMGLEPVFALSVPVAFIATALAAAAPADRGRWDAVLAALVALAIGFAGASVVPRYSRDEPRNVNLVHLESADTREAFWLASDRASDELSAALALERHQIIGWPWPSQAHELEAASAPPSNAAGAGLEVLERELTPWGRRLSLRVTSARGARVAVLRVPAAARIRAASVEGIARPLEPGQRFAVNLRGLPPEGVELTLEFEGQDPAPVLLWDMTPGLPPGGERYLQARPPNSVPVQDGDRSLLYRTLTLP